MIGSVCRREGGIWRHGCAVGVVDSLWILPGTRPQTEFHCPHKAHKKGDVDSTLRLLLLLSSEAQENTTVR